VLREDEKPWRALSIGEVSDLFRHASFPWWVAGGHAIERYVRRPIRNHADIDVLILRRDAQAVRHLLRDWDVWMSDPPGALRPWSADERFPAGARDVWCRRTLRDPWGLQLMIDESDGDRWHSRRSSRVSLPIDAMGWLDDDGVPILRPEIQLFYKARNPRPKDWIDLAACLPLLGDWQRRWLTDAIGTAYGEENEWCLISSGSSPTV